MKAICPDSEAHLNPPSSTPLTLGLLTVEHYPTTRIPGSSWTSMEDRPSICMACPSQRMHGMIASWRAMASALGAEPPPSNDRHTQITSRTTGPMDALVVNG